MWEDSAGSQMTLNAFYHHVFIPASSHCSHVISEIMEPIFRNVHLEQVSVEKSLIRARIKRLLHIPALPNPCASPFSFHPSFYCSSRLLECCSSHQQKSEVTWILHIFWTRAPPPQINRPSLPSVPRVSVTRSVTWKWSFPVDQGYLSPLNF